MKASDIMTAKVHSAKSSQSIADAARMMVDKDVGMLPVLENRKLVGIITDRDIAVRAVASGISPDSPLGKIMSKTPVTCRPDEDLEEILETMSNEQVRRLPVCDDSGEVMGIVALADAVQRDPEPREVAEALADICEPKGAHSQSLMFA